MTHNRVRDPFWVLILVGLVLLVSNQHALRDPRVQVLPTSYWPDTALCGLHPGSAPAAPDHTHTSQPHCPLCIMGGFSDGAAGFPTVVPAPHLQRLDDWTPHPQPRPQLMAVFPLLNRGPPVLA